MTSNTPVTDALKQVLADTYTLYLKTQNYHWNVTGPSFRSLHMLFEEQYNDMFAANDEIAERIRALGEKAPGGYSAFSKLTKISEGDNNKNAEAMLEDLYASQQQMIATLKAGIDIAGDANDNVTEDMLIGRLQVHEKQSWMLAASLPEETRSKLQKAA